MREQQIVRHPRCVGNSLMPLIFFPSLLINFKTKGNTLRLNVYLLGSGRTLIAQGQIEKKHGGKSE